MAPSPSGPGVAGDKVLAAIREGVLAGVSMRVTPLRSRDVDGVTQRMKAHLTGVALVPNPAYRSAKVFGIRKALRGEQAGPASTAEFTLWDLERHRQEASALQMLYLDDAASSGVVLLEPAVLRERSALSARA